MVRKLVSLSETTEFTPTGELRRVAIYSFMFDDYGPRELRIPVKEETPEAIEQWLDKQEAIISKYAKK